MYRAPTMRHARIAGNFIDWGIPTADSLIQVRQAAPELPAIASGGIRDGIDVAKCVALGATLVGLASPFLRAATVSDEAVVDAIDLLADELRIAMFCTGAGDVTALREPGRLVVIGDR